MKTSSSILLTLLLLLSLVTAIPMMAVSAQVQQQPLTPASNEPFTDENHGYRIQLPANWVFDDKADFGETGNEELTTGSLELLGVGLAPVGTFCPQEATQLQIGGERDCFLPNDTPASSDLITVGIGQYRFDLQHMSEFANLIEQGRDITTADLLVWELQRARAPASLIGSALENVDVQVISESDRTTNLIDADTGEVIASDVPVKEVQYTYRSYAAEANNLPEPDQIETILLAVYNNPDGNQEPDDVKAFKLEVGAQNANVQTTPPGTMTQRPEVRQIFDSFELIEDE
jgi:hypothetical protein